jgi:type IV pilus assembly protein PilC
LQTEAGQVTQYYRYKAVDPSGAKLKGRLTADSRNEAFHYLSSRHLFILELRELRFRTALMPDFLCKTLEKIGYKAYSCRDLMLFCRQLATMLQAGVSLLQALSVLANRLENSAFRNRLQSVVKSIEEGASFSEALLKENDFFPPLLIGMAETGETAGVLDSIMEKMAEHYEKQYDLEEKLRTATAYPLFILVVSFVVILIMITFVLPRFAGIFDAYGMAMPLFSRLMLIAGKLAARFWPLVLLLPFFLYYIFRQLTKIDRGRMIIDRLKLKLPLYGKIYLQTAAARFARSLSTLLGSGVTLYQALNLVDKVINNHIISDSISDLRNALCRGESISGKMQNDASFPPLLVEMVRVGEESGSLEFTLERTALFYEKEVSYLVERLGSVLEPILLILVGLFIGLIVYSVLSPMYQVFQMI